VADKKENGGHGVENADAEYYDEEEDY